MAADQTRVEMRLSDDARLVSAVAGAAMHFAQRTGFDVAGQSDLMAATEAACRDTFKLLSPNGSMLAVTIQDFPDRVEVILEHQGEALPTVGLDTFAFDEDEDGGGSDLTGLVLLSRVDRVQYQTESGTSRTTLVKYLPGRSPKS